MKQVRDLRQQISAEFLLVVEFVGPLQNEVDEDVGDLQIFEAIAAFCYF